jgi:hypothetical protein
MTVTEWPPTKEKPFCSIYAAYLLYRTRYLWNRTCTTVTSHHSCGKRLATRATYLLVEASTAEAGTKDRIQDRGRYPHHQRLTKSVKTVLHYSWLQVTVQDCSPLVFLLPIHFTTTMNAKSGTFWLGVTLSLCGSLCSALGLACQRLSHKRNQVLPPEEQIRSSRQWLNLLGVFLLFIESLFDLASFGFAPASILSCMGAMTLVFNMILAPSLCGETVSRRDVGVNCIVFLGTIISVSFGPDATPDYTLPELMSLFLATRFLVYAFLLFSWIGTLFYVWYNLRDVENPKGRFINMDRLTRIRLLRFTYPALAGSIGGNTAVYAKASIELVKTTIKGDNQFVYGGTYFLIFLMIVCVFGQLKFLNGGLKRYESLYVVPVYQVFWIGNGVFGALFYFNEVSSIPPRDLGLFFLGFIVSVFGILLHVTRKAPQDPTVGPELFAEDFDAAGCVSPSKEAFDVVEEYTSEYYMGSPRRVHSATDVEENRYNSEPMLILKNTDSNESFQSDEQDESEDESDEEHGDNFNSRRRRFMTA